MAVADRNGLPIAVGIASGEKHETTLAYKTVKSCFTGQLPKNLIGDKAYDSAALTKELARLGVRLISPHRSGRIAKTQDGRRLRRYRHRWRVERMFSWLKRFRRICTRWDRNADIFLGFVQLGASILLLRALRDQF